MNRVSNSLIKVRLNGSAGCWEALSKSFVFVYIDSVLRLQESEFLFAIFKKASFSRANFLFETTASNFLCDFLNLALKNPDDAFTRIFFFSESFENLPFNQIAVRTRGSGNRTSEFLASLILLLKIDLHFLIFKAAMSNKLVDLLNFFASHRQAVMVVPASPFSDEYSGNIFAMQEGATPLTSPSDLPDFINS